MAEKKTAKKPRKPRPPRTYTEADLSFDFGYNVTPKTKSGKPRKPSGGGSV